MYEIKQMGLCRPVIIAIMLLPFVDSLVFRTASHSYSESHKNQLFEIHEDFRLVGHVIETLITDEFGCGLRCARNRKCQSYNCHSGRHLGNETCQLNDQTRHSKPKDFIPSKGFTNYGKKKLGSFSSSPAHSCDNIRDSGDSEGDGEYWIDPEKDGNPLKVYCDMTTDGGGWLLVANFMMDDSTPRPSWPIETSYRGIGNYDNNRMGIAPNAMNELRTHLNFTQLRLHCSKQQGRTFHVTTVANSTGEAVVQYFSGQTDVLPSSCNSFQRLDGDNSQLAMQCDKWGRDGSYYVGKWGYDDFSGEYKMYNHAAFIASNYKWYITNGYWLCDDDESSFTLSQGDFWKAFVR